MQTVSYCYDELHRVTGKGYGAQSCPLSSPVVNYTYDTGANAKGKLVSMADQAGTASYSYDVLGRLATETRMLTGANNAAISKTLSYEYNLDGSLKTLHYPSGAAVTYTPDSAGRTVSAVDSANGQLCYRRHLRAGWLTHWLYQRQQRRLCRNYQHVQLQQTLAAGEYVGFSAKSDGVFNWL